MERFGPRVQYYLSEPSESSLAEVLVGTRNLFYPLMSAPLGIEPIFTSSTKLEIDLHLPSSQACTPATPILHLSETLVAPVAGNVRMPRFRSFGRESSVQSHTHKFRFAILSPLIIWTSFHYVKSQNHRHSRIPSHIIYVAHPMNINRTLSTRSLLRSKALQKYAT